jgi:hypothetical protein
MSFLKSVPGVAVRARTSVLAYIARVGIGADMFINVLTGGQLAQTVSYRCAVAARNGNPAGCFMCWFLNWAVQHDHCADQFTDAPTPWFDGIRAALAFLFGFYVLFLIIKSIIGIV